MFGRYATDWLGPPRGTRFGWPRGLSLQAVAGDQHQALSGPPQAGAAPAGARRARW